MDHQLLPPRMSLPEVMGDPCASQLRGHALALLRATANSEKLIRSHPGVAQDLASLRDSVQRFASAVLDSLAAEAGIPTEGESISTVTDRFGDYRIDRSSGCWIWMRSVNRAGYPLIGRKANGRENVPAKIYWMLEHGPLDDDELVVRTCGSRLCINPEHGRVTDRREHGAQRMREGSKLNWRAVREIRSTLCASSPTVLREHVAALAERLDVTEHSILDVFRNKVWVDRDYAPGFEIACANPECAVVFRTTSMIQRYHAPECQAEAARNAGRQPSDLLLERSPERRAREEAARQAELAAATEEWSGVLANEARTSVWSVASIDQPIGDDGTALQEVLASPTGSNPAAEYERKVTRKLLGDLTEEAVAAMDEVELAKVRAQIDCG